MKHTGDDHVESKIDVCSRGTVYCRQCRTHSHQRIRLGATWSLLRRLGPRLRLGLGPSLLGLGPRLRLGLGPPLLGLAALRVLSRLPRGWCWSGAGALSRLPRGWSGAGARRSRGGLRMRAPAAPASPAPAASGLRMRRPAAGTWRPTGSPLPAIVLKRRSAWREQRHAIWLRCGTARRESRPGRFWQPL
jgi:hypothetical protein